MKAIETEYKGYRFRSRLEARWAVFLDACGVKWEYEPEGFDLGDGLYYLPDFLLHDVWIPSDDWTKGNEYQNLWVEVKGKFNEGDSEKIEEFHLYSGYPILVLTNIPDGNDIGDLCCSATDLSWNNDPVKPFNAEMVYCNNLTVIPCVDKQGRLTLTGYKDTENINEYLTVNAYRLARQARFEHRNYFKPLEKSIPTKKEKIGAEFLPTTTGKSLKEQILQWLNEQEDKSVW